MDFEELFLNQNTEKEKKELEEKNIKKSLIYQVNE